MNNDHDAETARTEDSLAARSGASSQNGCVRFQMTLYFLSNSDTESTMTANNSQKDRCALSDNRNICKVEELGGIFQVRITGWL